ncbi:MAG: DUF4013 domain-containing protein [Candidatus Dojkabacteria bacterium]
MESFKVNEAWTYLFKEKQWGWKLFIPLILMGLLVAVILLLGIPLVVSAVGASSGKSNTEVFGGIFLIALLCMCCLLFVYVIVASIVNLWYNYEYTQISLEGRESTLIYKSKFIDVLKRAGKLYLVNFIYNIPTSILVSLFYVMFILAGGTAGLATSSKLGTLKSAPTFSAAAILILCMIFLIVIFIVLPYNFYIVQTARVQLIKTNTFSKAFQLSTIFSIIKKNFYKLSMFLGILFLYGLAYIMLNFVLGLLSIIPLVGLCLIPANFLLSILVVFFTMFVYPYMVGSVYKDLK